LHITSGEGEWVDKMGRGAEEVDKMGIRCGGRVGTLSTFTLFTFCYALTSLVLKIQSQELRTRLN
jgi:hypothetical protein